MTEASEQPQINETVQPSFEAVIACGMGPMELKDSRDPKKNPIPTNVFNFFNAVATKILVSKGLSREGILSGYPSSQVLKDIAQSEGGVLAHIYNQTRPKNTDRQSVLQAADAMIIEENARTTFGNIFEGLNHMDKKDPKRYFDGSFGVVSCEFHGPRIREMLTALGLKNGRFVSAEGVLAAAGYIGGVRGFGEIYKTYNNGAYPGQPAGLQNLQDNPSYVTRDLAVITSSRRFHEVSSALRDYYVNRSEPVELPKCFQEIPDAYDPGFDYEGLKQKFAAVPFTKHQYKGDNAAAVEAYTVEARGLTRQTQKALS